MAKAGFQSRDVALKPKVFSLSRHRYAYSLLRAGLILRHDQGSVLVFALAFLFIVLATSIAISNRGAFGLFGSLYSQESKFAKEAADVGILRAVMLLNEPKNRNLLVNANDLDGLTGNDLKVSANNKYINPCQGSGSPDLMVSGSSMGIKDSNGNVSGYPTLQIDDGTAANGLSRKFRILSIRQAGLPSLSGSLTGGIRITVQGQALRNGKVVATSNTTRELEVIEKCCGLSIGGPSQVFGGDTRSCDQNNPGLGLIAGTYYKGNGRFNTTGNTGISFRDADGNAIPQVYCLDVNIDNDCSDGGLDNGTGTKLVEVTPKLNDVPPIPSFPSTATSCDAITPPLSCNIEIDEDTTLSTADFANWGSAQIITTCTLATCTTTTSVTTERIRTEVKTATLVPNLQKCTDKQNPVSSCKNKNDTYLTTPSLTSFVTTTQWITITNTITTTLGLSTTTIAANPDLSDLKSHCFQSGTVTYCSLNSLTIANNKKLNIDTSFGPIRFYFPNPSTDPPTIDLKNGQSAITQTNGYKSPLSYTDLVFYGIPRSEIATKCADAVYATACQQVELGGGNASSTSFFSYFPGGETTMFGTATINGVIWSNIINATGSTNFVTSSSGIGDVLTLLGMSNPGSSGGGSLNILGEFVTRLTRKFTFF